MKFLGKIAAAGLAVATAFSAFAFSACDNVTAEEKGKQEATAVIENLENVKTDAVGISGTVSTSTEDVVIDAKVNPVSGTGDVECKMTSKEQDAVSKYGYLFIRDWQVYSAESETKKDSFAAGDLSLVADIKAMISEQAGADVSKLLPVYVPTAVNAVVSAEAYTMLALGKVTNSVSVNGNALTFDMNKAAYTMITDAKEVLNGVTATTTVGDILANTTVKKYAQIFTELVTYDEIVSGVTQLKAMLGVQGQLPAPTAEGEPEISEGGLDMAGMLLVINVLDDLLKIVKPDENSSTYDYIVKLISSDELKDTINGIISQTSPEAPLTKNLDEYSILDIASLSSGQEVTEEMLNTELDKVKAEFATAAECVTAERITVTNSDGSSSAMSGMKVTFNYDSEHVLTSQGFEGRIETQSGQQNPVTLSEQQVPATEVTFNLQIEFANKAYVLKNIPKSILPAPSQNG